MVQSSEFQRLVGNALRYWFSDTVIFENYRPVWLKGLELDFYLPQYHIAFEVQGRQHYLLVPRMQATVEDYKAQRERDRLKQKLANRQGVRVLVIKSFTGIYTKLRNAFPNRKFGFLPTEIRQEWKIYRRRVHEKKQNEWVAIKVKKSDQLIGVNRVASRYLKNNKDAILRKDSKRNKA